MIIRNKAIESLMYYQTISDIIILATYKGRPVDILIIKVMLLQQQQILRRLKIVMRNWITS